VAEKEPQQPDLPIELSSVVSALETLTRELTKKLTADQTREVVDDLCSRLRTIGDKRAPDRPFTKR
jgi:hypothetical protein